MDLFNLDERLLQCSMEKGHGESVGPDRVDTGTAMRKDCKHPEGAHNGSPMCLLAFRYCHRHAQDNQLIKRLTRCSGTCL